MSSAGRSRVRIRDEQHSSRDAFLKNALKLCRLVRPLRKFGVGILDGELVISADADGVSVL